MSEISRRLPDEIFEITDADREAEAKLPSGYIPERWLRIETAEVQRMREALETVLQERTQGWAEEELGARAGILQRHWDADMLPPSFPGGPHALQRWLNFYESLNRVVDLKTDETLVPDKDERISFSSGAFDKGGVILNWLRDKVQASLGENNQFTEAQLRECFTNVSQQQLHVLSQEIAKSGLTIFPETFHERLVKLVEENSEQK